MTGNGHFSVQLGVTKTSFNEIIYLLIFNFILILLFFLFDKLIELIVNVKIV